MLAGIAVFLATSGCGDHWISRRSTPGGCRWRLARWCCTDCGSPRRQRQHGWACRSPAGSARRLSATAGSGGCEMSSGGCGPGCPPGSTWWWWCGRLARRGPVQRGWRRLSGCCSTSSAGWSGKSAGGQQLPGRPTKGRHPTPRNRHPRGRAVEMAGRFCPLLERVAAAADRLAVSILLGLVTAYRLLLSPLLGRHCRFQPSCSQYFAEAVRKYGAVRGSIKGIGRICRCHPWHPGGHDPP